jgi:hypothetical protein
MSTPSDAKLYMTEDLDGRLDLTSLENDQVNPINVYEDETTSFVTQTLPQLEPVKAVLLLIFENGESFVVDGDLQALSFGKEGWLCTVSTESKLVLPVALRAAKSAPINVHLSLPLLNGIICLQLNIDCTASFAYSVASFTVTSDEASYV